MPSISRAGALAALPDPSDRAGPRGPGRLRGTDRPSPWQWLALAGGSLTCLALAGHAGVPSAGTMLAIIVASALSSIAGFAFSAICGAMLFHLAGDPVGIVQIMITCSIANQAAMVWALRRHVNWAGLSVFLVGGLLGLPLGVWALIDADRHAFTAGLGVFLLAYGASMLARRPFTCPHQHPLLDGAAGFLGGVTGGAAGFPGASVTIWCGGKGWPKDRQRALFQPFILVMQVAALALIAAARGRAGGPAIDPASLLCIPGSLLGTKIGLLLYGRLSDVHFARAINLLLIVSGLSFLL
ncbi:sulfite exporter TauE/SafE family protein [Methylobacterium sp. JK268]